MNSAASVSDPVGNIVIISNRGPHDFVVENGNWTTRRSSSALVSMLEPLARQPDVAWFCCVSEAGEAPSDPENLLTTARDQTDADLNVVPVPMPADIYNTYYGTISNEVLWRLQYHLLDRPSLNERQRRAWTEGYLEANKRLADAVFNTELPVRAFLVQDYHLYPLPALLRERFPTTPSLHFTHIPFPDPLMLQRLPEPWWRGILEGMLGADLVGLQTPGDLRAFLAGCSELLHLEANDAAVILPDGREVAVRAFGASVDPARVRAFQQSPGVAKAREELDLSGPFVTRVDHLDPTKNQELGFRAFDHLLTLHRELRGAVRFLAFLIPSRTDLTVYRGYHDQVIRAVHEINARHRDACGGDPIRVFYTNNREMAFAALEQADALLINSQHDGVQLVAKEWALASKKPGCLIISETAGFAAETGDAALVISPKDIDGIATAMAHALEMPHEERLTRLTKLRQAVESWTAEDWLHAQLDHLRISVPRAAERSLSDAIPRTDGSTAERTLTVLNRKGLHARPAAEFVKCVRSFESEIDLIVEGEIISGRSILAVLTTGLEQGAQFLLRAHGSDAEEAVTAIEKLMETVRDEEERELSP